MEKRKREDDDEEEEIKREKTEQQYEVISYNHKNRSVLCITPPPLNNKNPVCICLLVDVSGSMESNMSILNKSLDLAVGKLRVGDGLVIITYSAKPECILTGIYDGTLQAPFNLTAKGMTMLTPAFDLAEEELKRGEFKEMRKMMYILTDGEFNGPKDDKIVVRIKPDLGFNVGTIALGKFCNFELLEEIAGRGYGPHIVVKELEDLDFSNAFQLSSNLITADAKINVYNLFKNLKTTSSEFENGLLKIGPLLCNTTKRIPIQHGGFQSSKLDIEGLHIKVMHRNDKKFVESFFRVIKIRSDLCGDFVTRADIKMMIEELDKLPSKCFNEFEVVRSAAEAMLFQHYDEESVSMQKSSLSSIDFKTHWGDTTRASARASPPQPPLPGTFFESI